MKLTSLEDNIGCGCTEKLSDSVFTQIPGIDRPFASGSNCGRCGHSPCRCGKGANTVTQNPVINVNVGNEASGSNSQAQTPSSFEGNSQYIDELIIANKRIAELENRKPKVEIQKVDRPVIIDRPVKQVEKVYRTIPIDRIKKVKEVVNKIIPLDRIKTIFKKQDVVIPLQKIKYANPNTQRSSFEGAQK